MRNSLLKPVLTVLGLFVMLYSFGQEDKQEQQIQKGQFLPYQGKQRSYSNERSTKTLKSVQNPFLLKSASVSASLSDNDSILFEENFEGTISGWTIESDWEIGTPTSGPNSGYNSTNCAATVLTGAYNDNSNYRLISPTITLPSLTNPSAQIELKLYEWFYIESGYDYGKIEVSTDGGTTWTELDSRSGVSDWIENLILLTSYEGQTIQLGFHFTSDGTVTQSGWYIDNIVIQTTTPAFLTSSINNLNAQNFPFVYMNIAVDTNGTGISSLDNTNFIVTENGTNQTDFFEVTPPSQGNGSRLADIVFLVDNSGSFDDYQNAVYNNMVNFIDQLKVSGIDYSLGLCRFGQDYINGNPILEESGQLTSDADYFKNTIWGRNVIDGGTEPAYYAITQSVSGFSFRPGSQKIFIILADEDPDQGGASQQDAIDAASNNSVTLFSLTTSDSEGLNLVATESNGRYYNITDPFTDILNDITTTIGNTYLVKYRSLNPNFDGVERNIRADVTYQTYQAYDTASYIPGSLPNIERSQTTQDLENQSWAESTIFTIEAIVKDNVMPFVQNVTLFYKNSSEGTFSNVSMTNSNDTVWSADIPTSSVLSPGIDYYITASDGQGTASLPKVTPAQNPFQIAILPNYKPIIVHELVTGFEKGGLLTFDAEITDNTNSLDSVAFFHRRVGQLSYTISEMTNVSGDSYQFQHQTTDSDTIGIEYYIKAVDDLGLSATFYSADNPVRINVSGDNHAPVMMDQQFTLVEDAGKGDTIGLLLSQDLDTIQTMLFIILDGNLNNVFFLDAFTGMLTVNNIEELNYNENPVYELKTVVYDNGEPTLTDTAIVTVYIHEVVSIYNNRIEQKEVKVYPNPSQCCFTISFADNKNINCTLEVYNPLGMLVKTEEISGNQHEIKLKGYPKGVYYLRFVNQHISVTKQVLIE